MQLNHRIGIRRKPDFSEKTWNNCFVSNLTQSISTASYLPFFPEHFDIRHVARRLCGSAFFAPKVRGKSQFFDFFIQTRHPKIFFALLVSVDSPRSAEPNDTSNNTLSWSNRIIVLPPQGGYQYYVIILISIDLAWQDESIHVYTVGYNHRRSRENREKPFLTRQKWRISLFSAGCSDSLIFCS